jgi:hypothetical protein
VGGSVQEGQGREGCFMNVEMLLYRNK